MQWESFSTINTAGFSENTIQMVDKPPRLTHLTAPALCAKHLFVYDSSAEKKNVHISLENNASRRIFACLYFCLCLSKLRYPWKFFESETASASERALQGKSPMFYPNHFALLSYISSAFCLDSGKCVHFTVLEGLRRNWNVSTRYSVGVRSPRIIFEREQTT